MTIEAPICPSPIEGDRGQHVPDALDYYVSLMYRFETLTREEEVELAQAMEAGREALQRLADEEESLPDDSRQQLSACITVGQEAREKFICHNLRLVVSIAKKHQGKGVELGDLIQEGNLGLFSAVDKFDWRKGFSFGNYATWWVSQAVDRAIAEKGSAIKTPIRQKQYADAITRTILTLGQRGVEATDERIMQESGFSDPVQLNRLRNLPQVVGSLNDPLGPDSADGEFSNFIADMSHEEIESLISNIGSKQLLEMLLRESQIQPLAKEMLAMRFGLFDGQPRNCSQVAEHFGLSVGGVWKMTDRAMQALKTTGQEISKMARDGHYPAVD